VPREAHPGDAPWDTPGLRNSDLFGVSLIPGVYDLTVRLPNKDGKPLASLRAFLATNLAGSTIQANPEPEPRKFTGPQSAGC